MRTKIQLVVLTRALAPMNLLFQRRVIGLNELTGSGATLRCIGARDAAVGAEATVWRGFSHSNFQWPGFACVGYLAWRNAREWL
jgi:hypothetical protein